MRSFIPLVCALVLVGCGADRPSTIGGGSSPGTQAGTDRQAIEPGPLSEPFARLVPGDDLDAIEAAVRPPARFAGQTPRFTVEWRTFRFQHLGKVEEKRWQVVLDGDRVVALLRSGDIELVGFTPDHAPTVLALPKERYHLDNLIGPMLNTGQLLGPVWTHGSIYDEAQVAANAQRAQERWESDGRTLVLVRQRRSADLDADYRFTFSLDPVYGYRVDADQRIAWKRPPGPKDAFHSATFCPGNYVPWPSAIRYDRTVFTPADLPGWKGWANNNLCMERCDDGRTGTSGVVWRDGGFIAYLDPRSGWSPVRTRKDGLGPFRATVCNAHNDFHISLRFPEVAADSAGRRAYRCLHRLMAMPPEMTRHVWDGTTLIQEGQRGLILGLGSNQDFEDQPVLLTEPRRGLVWTGGGPRVVDGHAHSGAKSLEIIGRSWPNLPQVSLAPGQPYRLSAWFKVRPWTADELAAAQAKDAANRAKLAKDGKPQPPAVDWSGPPRAWIAADYYEWSPYADAMVERMRTNEATRIGEWQQVILDFTAPDWGPFVNIAFHADNGVALLDDFSFAPR
ncbi:hypothetical protein LBMAG53_10820 [Planctomycetota bacterium]|nr:hypothetical protein LBMAG53_10820 [Planctomycetota bacterium]